MADSLSVRLVYLTSITGLENTLHQVKCDRSSMLPKNVKHVIFTVIIHALLMMFRYGLRVGEAVDSKCGLRWDAVMWGERQIFITREKGSDSGVRGLQFSQIKSDCYITNLLFARYHDQSVAPF
ncbi:MAG: hypothetical protein V7K92_19510 [Nostoc sp.]